MKRSFMPSLALMLVFCTAVAFTGCESAVSPVDTGNLNVSRSVAADAVEPVAVSVSGPVVVIDGKAAVAYQGIPYYLNGGDLTEGAVVTVSGSATPVIEWDAEGNFLFYGYSVKDAKVTVNG